MRSAFPARRVFFVKASRRFVQHDETSLPPERPGQVEPALFAAGKSVLLAADLRVHGRAALGIPLESPASASVFVSASSCCAVPENMVRLSRMEAL